MQYGNREYSGHYLPWASTHKAGGRHATRYREVSKRRDSGLDFSNRSEIQQRCRDACQISKRYDHNDIQPRLRDFTRSSVNRTLGSGNRMRYHYPPQIQQRFSLTALDQGQILFIKIRRS